MKGMCFGLAILLAAVSLFAKDNSRSGKITVRTSVMVSSDRSLSGDSVDAVLVDDFVINGKTVATSGALAHGIVSSATPSRSGKLPIPGSISIRLETVDTSQGSYRLSTNEYTRQGKGGPRSPSGGGISVDSVGGVQPQSPIPGTDPSGISLGSTGPEAIIPSQSVVTFKVAAVQKN